MGQIIEITDLDLKELEPYTCRSEVRLFRYFEPEPGIFLAESLKVIERGLAAGYEPMSFLMERKLIEGPAAAMLARWNRVPVYTADPQVLSGITGYQMTLGALCVMRRKPLPEVEEICAGKNRIAVLEDIENPANIGAAFRSAAALGFDGVLLTPGCSDPLYRRALRVSVGTVFQIPWTWLREPDRVENLRKAGFSTAAMMLGEDSVGIDDPDLMAEERLAVFLGNEGKGLTRETVMSCDYRVKIPMSHGVDSLNVAAASAVAFWQLGRRR